MKVHFSSEKEAQISQLAAHSGIDPENFVRDAALQRLDETTRFRAAVRDGVTQADRGEMFDDDEVLRWLERKERT